MSAYLLAYSPELPWFTHEEERRRLRKITRRVFLLCLLLAVVTPFLPVPTIEREQAERIPPRLARLALERQQAQRPEPAPAPVEQTKRPAPRRVPKVAKAEPPKAVVPNLERAREKAQRAGLLAFKDELAALREDANVRRVTSAQRLTRGAERQVARVERSIIATQATNASGGINTAALSRDTGGGALAGRAHVQVKSPLPGMSGHMAGTPRAGGGRKAARSIEEIQLIFDRNKAAIYALYNRALRVDPSLQGKVVLRITIAPSGGVLSCELVSSELRATDLERKILARIRLFDFGAKDVETMVVTYPIEFLPS